MKRRGTIKVFGRRYAVPPWLSRTRTASPGKGKGEGNSPRTAPLVAVCLDGHDPSYMHLLSRGRSELFRRKQSDELAAPSLRDAFAQAGPSALADRRIFTPFLGRCAMPSFTNPNNVSIITGRPPKVHGICGNYFVDPRTATAVPMNDPSHFITRPGDGSVSFLSALCASGLRVGCITSKDKLLRMLRGGIPAAHATQFFSIESLGVPMYAPEATLEVFRRGIAMQLDAATRCDVLYLTTTDFMQHTYPPTHPTSIAFYNELDSLIRRLIDDAECVVGVTADHGMSTKRRIVFAGDVLLQRGVFANAAEAKSAVQIVLPITDPHVVHHAALGSFAWLHLIRGPRKSRSGKERALQRRITTALRSVDGLEIFTRAQAAAKFGLPRDRIGDIVMSANETTAVGSFEAEHDLGKLQGTILRSHGGVTETDVPLLVDRRLSPSRAFLKARPQLSNWDLFPLLLSSSLAP